MTIKDRLQFVENITKSLLETQGTIPHRMTCLLTQYLDGNIPAYEILKELRDDYT